MLPQMTREREMIHLRTSALVIRANLGKYWLLYGNNCTREYVSCDPRPILIARKVLMRVLEYFSMLLAPLPSRFFSSPLSLPLPSPLAVSFLLFLFSLCARLKLLELRCVTLCIQVYICKVCHLHLSVFLIHFNRQTLYE